MLEIKCEYCGTNFGVEEDAPMIVRCPYCLKEFDVPAAKGSEQAIIPEGSNVLPYRAPDKAGVRAGPFMAGFFGTLGFTGVVFFLLAMLTVQSPPPGPGSQSDVAGRCFVLLLIAFAYVGIGWQAYRLSRQAKWAGIGRGVIVGICLSMIAMVPCAGIFIKGFDI